MKTKKAKIDLPTLKAQIVEEVGRTDPRIDTVVRLVGQFNRLRGRQLHRSVLQMIGKPGATKVVSEILGDHR